MKQERKWAKIQYDSGQKDRGFMDLSYQKGRSLLILESGCSLLPVEKQEFQNYGICLMSSSFSIPKPIIPSESH